MFRHKFIQGLTTAAMIATLSVQAHASTTTTYDFSTTTDGITISGTISGSGTTLSAFDFTVVTNSQTFTFQGTSSSDFYAYGRIIPSLAQNYIFAFRSTNQDLVNFDVTGSFDTGLSPVSTSTYINLGLGSAPATSMFENQSGSIIVNFTPILTQDVPVPEPLSLALLGTSLAGLGLARARRR